MDYPAGALSHKLKLEQLADEAESNELFRYYDIKEQLQENPVTYEGIAGSKFTLVHDVLEKLSDGYEHDKVIDLVKMVYLSNVADAEIGKLFRDCIDDCIIELAKD